MTAIQLYKIRLTCANVDRAPIAVGGEFVIEGLLEGSGIRKSPETSRTQVNP